MSECASECVSECVSECRRRCRHHSAPEVPRYAAGTRTVYIPWRSSCPVPQPVRTVRRLRDVRVSIAQHRPSGCRSSRSAPGRSAAARPAGASAPARTWDAALRVTGTFLQPSPRPRTRTPTKVGGKSRDGWPTGTSWVSRDGSSEIRDSNNPWTALDAARVPTQLMAPASSNRRGSRPRLDGSRFSDFRGSSLGSPRRWLGAQWLSLTLGVPSRPEPPGAR
eukprot:scaffold109659_cov51-Phaeocystis_antarctica.AAC.2